MRRGITLLELLVVMLILLMVTAAAIPIIAPAMQNRQMRESTRLVTSFIGAAKARAVQTGRPVGVVIERENGQAFAFRMAQVEVPPPYSGDVVGAKLAVVGVPESSASINAKVNFGALFVGSTAVWFHATEPAAGMLNTTLLRVGDQIQFNGQGPHFTILGPDPDANGSIGDVTSTTPLEFAYAYVPPLKQAFPWTNTAPAPQPASYQIARQPVRTSSPPLQLPETIAFDLSLSGAGGMLYNIASYSDPIGTVPVNAPRVLLDPVIIFSPAGRVEWVSVPPNGQLIRTTDPVYILIGRRELMFDVTSRTQASDAVFQNLSAVPVPVGQRMPPAENYWLVIGSQGDVSTAQVAPNFQDYTNSTGAYSTWAELITAARNESLLYAKERQSLPGR